MKRYADGTTVPVSRSRSEIADILAKHGVEQQAWGSGPMGDQLQFALHGHQYRLAIPKPTEEWARRNAGPRTYLQDAMDREWRRRWRATVLLLKAKLEFADGDASTVEYELMPYMLTAGGRTLGQLVEEGLIEDAIGVPLLGAGG